jgi:hypothetical protein
MVEAFLIGHQYPKHPFGKTMDGFPLSSFRSLTYDLQGAGQKGFRDVFIE